MSLFLSSDELYYLSGYKKPKRQIAWLRAAGFIFRIAADGHPRVDRSHYEKVMGCAPDASSMRTKTTPNFAHLQVVGGRA